MRSALAFNIYARFNGENSFQAGTYDLREKLGVKGAVRELKKGPRIDYVVLKIPPGFWVKQIAARVAALGGGRSAQTFLDGTRNNAVRSTFEPADVSNLEGLLRPDTYKISESQDEIAILQTLVKTFDSHAEKLGLATANVRGHTAYDIIKVASIIESEAKVDAGPAADRVGDLQPARREHAAPDRRDRSLRAAIRRTGSCPSRTFRSSRPTTRTSRTPLCRPRRSRR